MTQQPGRTSACLFPIVDQTLEFVKPELSGHIVRLQTWA